MYKLCPIPSATQTLPTSNTLLSTFCDFKSLNPHLLETHSYLYYDSFGIPSLYAHLLETHRYSYYDSFGVPSLYTHLLETHRYSYYDSFGVPSLFTHLLETHSYSYYDSFRIPYVSDFSTETKRLTNHEQPRGTTWGQAPQTSGGRRVSNAWWT